VRLKFPEWIQIGNRFLRDLVQDVSGDLDIMYQCNKFSLYVSQDQKSRYDVLV